MSRLLVVFAGLLLPLCALAKSKPSLNLNDAIRIAIAHSPKVEALKAKHQMYVESRIHAWAPSSPDFSVEFGDLEAPPGTNAQSERVYHLTQSFGFPGSAVSHGHYYSQQAQATDFEVRAAQLTMKEEVTLAFDRLETLQKELEIQKKNKAQLLHLKLFARRKMAVNTSSEVEYLLIRSEWLQSQNQISDLKLQQAGARRKLNLLLGRRLDSGLKIQFSESDLPETYDLAALKTELLSTSPDLEAAILRARAAHTRVKSAWWAVAPNITLGIGMTEEHQTAETVGFSVPLWFWWNQRSEIRAAEANELREKMNYAETKRHLLKELSALVTKTNQDAYELKLNRTKLIPWSKRAMAVAWRNYRFGTIAFSTLQAAQQNQVAAALDEVLLNQDYRDNVARISVLVGGVH